MAALAAFAISGVQAQTGDSMCNLHFCITAILNGSTTTFEVLIPSSADQIGWIGTGFGTQMPGSPLVVLWPNADGTVTLSQRMASDYIMPTVQANPPRVATLSQQLTTLGVSETRITYTIPSDQSTQQNLLWSISSARPPSSAVDAQLIQHYDQGTYTLDLSKPLSALAPSLTSSFPPAPSATSVASDDDSNNGGPTLTENPFTPADTMIVTHAVLCSLAFGILMPLGSLFARLARTFIPQWFIIHWVINFWIALPLAVAGVGYGIHLVNNSHVPHLDTNHTRAGVAVFVLAFVQWTLGFIIHYLKPKAGWSARPPQNYAHGVLGVVIIALAFYTIYAGFTQQWPLITGRSYPHGIIILYGVWVAIIALAYVAGMTLLPRQYRQEADRQAEKDRSGSDMIAMRP
ncbi:CBD9-like protein [Dacryopinax primogenitus]|uniref:CBD9-like protein n=1 Tax=Dacryopinax primogenitus (strain DJM 731) TaxID=1858805 RepID=M5G802_DACPD|nr:CBD9-like protein [Dacryopinax primogenitus]EJU04265.1 CBD9-like protein [Dacryopinax primogenitus]